MCISLIIRYCPNYKILYIWLLCSFQFYWYLIGREVHNWLDNTFQLFNNLPIISFYYKLLKPKNTILTSRYYRSCFFISSTISSIAMGFRIRLRDFLFDDAIVPISVSWMSKAVIKQTLTRLFIFSFRYTIESHSSPASWYQ